MLVVVGGIECFHCKRAAYLLILKDYGIVILDMTVFSGLPFISRGEIVGERVIWGWV